MPSRGSTRGKQLLSLSAPLQLLKNARTGVKGNLQAEMRAQQGHTSAKTPLGLELRGQLRTH